MIRQTTVARRRVAGMVLGVFVSLALAGMAEAGMPPPASLALTTPAADAVIVQNDPSTGCTLDANRGYGFVINFSWVNPQLKGLKRYELVVQRTGSALAALDVIVTGTSFQWRACNAFVIDGNLTDWHWQVTALNNGAKVIARSEQRAFSFATCRLATGAVCSAP